MCIFGALYDGGFECMFAQKTSSDDMIKFLKTLYKKFGKIVMFVDNALYHKSQKAMQFTKV